MVKRLPTMRETQVRSLGRKDPLEKEMATHSRTLAWKIPWMEKHGRLLQSMESLRVVHNCATSQEGSGTIWPLALDSGRRSRHLPFRDAYFAELWIPETFPELNCDCDGQREDNSRNIQGSECDFSRQVSVDCGGNFIHSVNISVLSAGMQRDALWNQTKETN